MTLYGGTASAQALELENAVVFWGTPQHMCKTDAKQIIDKHLQAVETEMMLLDPIQFPAAIHEQPWPQYSLVLVHGLLTLLNAWQSTSNVSNLTRLDL